MIKFLKRVFTFLFIAITFNSFSQKLDIEFGSIQRSDLEMLIYQQDRSADAIILSDYGSAKLIQSGDGLQVVLMRNVRIKILNKMGFEFANVELPYSTGERISKIQASTYNIVSDSIIVSQLSKKDIINDKVSKYSRIVRIAFPNIKEGSIIEYQYELTTNRVYEFVPWQFQYEIPVRYSEFNAEFADYFNYRGVVKTSIVEIPRRSLTKNVNFAGNSTTATVHKWVGVDIPAFKYEPYITGVADYIVKLEFELAGINYPGGGYHVITPSYDDFSNRLLKRKDFGVALKETRFLKKPTQAIIENVQSETEKLKQIHKYISTKILWNGKKRYTTSKSLRRIFSQERGSSAEINMILVAMLRHAGINANPVVLSTRSNGELHPTIATVQKFNYLVAHVVADGKTYIIDATDPLLPFNVLPFECLNNKGWLIRDTNSEWIDLSNNEKDMTLLSINVTVCVNGTIAGVASNSYSGYSAQAKRKFIKIRSIEGFLKKLQTTYPNCQVDSLIIKNNDDLYASFDEKYNVSIENGAQVISGGIILNPYLLVPNHENPFVSRDRKYPVDFGVKKTDIFSINIAIPEGFEVDEMPTNSVVRLSNNGGSFYFTCEQSDNVLIIQSRINIDRIHFEIEEYYALRKFFLQVIRKHSELIVLKKKA